MTRHQGSYLAVKRIVAPPSLDDQSIQRISRTNQWNVFTSSEAPLHQFDLALEESLVLSLRDLQPHNFHW
jgi:hypothetical protein